ncbi:MAG: metalloenzyme [bacterium]|nr:metalloenzyme [bacterium]
MPKKKIIMIMIDGLGVPLSGWNDSVYSEFCSEEFTSFFNEYSIPIDACLGVDGIPQSATGQTTIYTGINAAELKGMHISGFPARTLKNIIHENNIFSKLISLGKKPIFANAYIGYTLEQLMNSRFASVTTVMSNAAFNRALNLKDLLDGRAVYHDITRFTAAQKHKINEISPELASTHLLNISKNYDFTLFEFFLTDKVGHSRNKSSIEKVFSILDKFLCHLRYNLYKDTVLIICSDHGNCENIEIKSHTKNKVPFLVYGSDIIKNKYKIEDLTGIYQTVLNIITK